MNQNRPPELSEQDAELLSAYLDGALNREERRILESRLVEDHFLQTELEALRQTVAWIHTLPELKAPRSFTLQPGMVAAPTAPKIVPMPRRARSPLWMGAAAAAAVFVVLVGVLAVIGPSVNKTFSDVVSSFNSAPPAAMVAAAPTGTAAPTMAVLMTMPAEPSPEAEIAAQLAAPASSEQDAADDQENASSLMMEESTANTGAEVTAEARIMAFSSDPAEDATGAADMAAGTGAAADMAAGTLAQQAPVISPKTALEDLLRTVLRVTMLILREVIR